MMITFEGNIGEDIGCDCLTCTCPKTYQAQITAIKDGKLLWVSTWGGFATKELAQVSLERSLVFYREQNYD